MQLEPPRCGSQVWLQSHPECLVCSFCGQQSRVAGSPLPQEQAPDTTWPLKATWGDATAPCGASKHVPNLYEHRGALYAGSCPDLAVSSLQCRRAHVGAEGSWASFIPLAPSCTTVGFYSQAQGCGEKCGVARAHLDSFLAFSPAPSPGSITLSVHQLMVAQRCDWGHQLGTDARRLPRHVCTRRGGRADGAS